MKLLRAWKQLIAVQEKSLIINEYLNYAKAQMEDRAADFVDASPVPGVYYKALSKVYDEDGLNLPYTYYILEDKDHKLYIALESTIIIDPDENEELPF